MITPNKKYFATVLDLHDPIFPEKLYVGIPELKFLSTGGMNTNGFLVENNLTNNYIGTKDEFDNIIYTGSFAPLLPGTDVIVEFLTDDPNSGRIVAYADTHKLLPTGINKNTDHLIASYNNNKVYLDGENNRFHVSLNGLSDFFMDEDGIVFQLSTNTKPSTFQSYMELNRNGFMIRFGDNILSFNDSGFYLTYGDKQANFSLTEKGLNLVGEEYINISTKGTLNLYGGISNIQGEGDLNIRGNNLKLTGSQKAALNGGIIHVNSWLDTHIKAGLNLSIESKLKLDIFSLLKDENILGVSNSFNGVYNETTMLKSETINFKASAISVDVVDGMVIKDMGIGSSTSSSMGLSTSAAMLSTKLSMMALTTTFNINNIGPSIASTVINETTTGDVATSASSFSISDFILSSPASNASELKTFINHMNDSDKQDKIRDKDNIRISKNIQLYTT